MNTKHDPQSHAMEKPDAAMPAAHDMAGRGMAGEEQTRLMHGSVAGRMMAGAQWNDVTVGVGLILLSLRRGQISGRYGNWQPYII